MRQVLFSCALLLAAGTAFTRADADTYTGTWSIQPARTADRVQLELRYSSGGDTWDDGNDVSISELQGLSNLSDASGERHFRIVHDAGTFDCVGTFANGSGGGTWTLEPSRSFADALAQRGLGTPSDREQFELAMADFHISTLDALLHAGFEKPSIDSLVDMINHGVNDEFISAMRGVALNPKTVGELSRMRDHGVDPRFAAAMMKYDPHLTGEDLATLRDHGVSAEYVAGLQQLGYRPSADELVRLRDHGVSTAFIQRLAQHGYSHLSVNDLIRLRDSGF